jgi:hypothetical protein
MWQTIVGLDVVLLYTFQGRPSVYAPTLGAAVAVALMGLWAIVMLAYMWANVYDHFAKKAHARFLWTFGTPFRTPC